MKGTPPFPNCGFSGCAAQAPKACGVTKNYADVPAFPQCTIKGKLISASDITLAL